MDAIAGAIQGGEQVIIKYSDTNENRIYWQHRRGEEWRTAELDALIEAYEREKTGKWIAIFDADGFYWTCSECGEEIPRISHYNPQFDLFPRLESINKTNYCPNCGAKMVN